MTACLACGHENRQAARFCEACGLRLAAIAGERRKVVSVLFCDVVGSTSLGESLDPEALRALLARYFDRMRLIIEHHGGVVEKFIGDAVMAVFGVPSVREDDALRACRAAVEMREAFESLAIEGRIGVSTGEVVTGTEERLATGDVVNVAARLQQSAEPGTVLISAATRALGGDALDVDSIESLAVKGKREPVIAFRLIDARASSERRHETRFVGRENELALVGGMLARALSANGCELVTIVGEAGIGKSRLVSEAIRSTDARVLHGRCARYGTGVTYGPVVEVVRQLAALPSDRTAAAAIGSLVGEGDRPSSAEEIAWAFRKLLEEHAPLVVVFDDIQWAEETFLDLVEHVSLLSRGEPLFIVCMARPELLDRRPSWPVTVRLGALAPAEASDLIGAEVDEGLAAGVAAAAGGNPLFITEMLAIAGDGDAAIEVPATLMALLAARLDQLEPRERRVLERAAVEGEIFHRGSIQAITPEESQVTPRLAALVRRDLIAPERASIADQDAFRFRHLLMRDSAYDAMPKTVRAELHERLAGWLEEHSAGLPERDELLGYHFEQAHRYKRELGDDDLQLAARGGEYLATAGRHAASRGDHRTAESILERALELTRPVCLDVMLELDLATAIAETDPARAVALAGSVVDRARTSGDQTDQLLAGVGLAYNRSLSGADTQFDVLEQLAREALVPLEEAGNHAGLTYVWWVLGTGVANANGRNEDWANAAEQALHYGRLAGRPSAELFHLPEALVYGPRPADEALRTLDAYLPEAPHPSPLLCRAWLLTMLARFAEADDIISEAGDRLRDQTGDGVVDALLGQIAETAGRSEDAVKHLRRYCDFAEAHGLRGYLATFAPMLGRSLCALKRYDEAEKLVHLSRGLGDHNDPATQTLIRQVQALIEASRNQHVLAEQLAREALAIGLESDQLNSHGDIFCDLAEVLATAGRRPEAREALIGAIGCYERKNNVAQAAEARTKLAAT